MMAAVEAVGQGGHVLVRNGEVVARIPLALGGLMSEGTAEDVAAQHDDFMAKARAMGIEPPLDPIMGIIFLPLPVIPTLRIRPVGPLARVSYLPGPCNVYVCGVLFVLPLGTVGSDRCPIPTSPKGAFLCLN